MKFEEYYWHDSEIRNIIIDRSNPRTKDIIVFEIDWIDKGLGKLIFKDVYSANINMNFGIITAECIASAYVTNENDLALTEVYQRWNGLINEAKLFCYVIKTISTGSEIKIIAKGFEVIYGK